MLAVIVAVLLTIPIAIVRGVVLVALWDWFVTPLGVASISIPQAIGLALIVGFLIPTQTRDDENHDSVWAVVGYTFAGSVFGALLTLALGALLAAFM
jgi:hypothetical protein